MESLIGLMVLLMVGAFLLRFLEPKSRPGRTRVPVSSDFIAKESPFTAAEARFLRVLDEALGEEYRVFAKLRLADLLDVRGERGAAWLRAFNQISAKHVDFVVCRRETLEVVAAVELDDRSHHGMRSWTEHSRRPSCRWCESRCVGHTCRTRSGRWFLVWATTPVPCRRLRQGSVVRLRLTFACATSAAVRWS